ncbi:MAG: translocation/assembly module TamB domain-containing protein [Vicinamibacteria bacterium]|nr:translocation/assembly module TamB domain-containing protein [Vicinamibacteria bacterium]
MVDEEPQDVAPPPRGRFRRWMRRALIGLVAIALGLLVVLHLPPVQRWLVWSALSSLQTRQSLDLTWRAVSFNLIACSAQIQGLRLGARGASAPLVAAEQVTVHFPFGLFRGKLDGLDVTLVKGTVTLAREQGHWTTIPAAWARSTPGSPPRSLPAFAALRLHDIAVVYDDRDAHFRTETKGLRVELLPTGSAPGDLAGQLVPGATTVVRWEPRGTTLTLRGGRAYFSPGGAGVKQLQLDAPEGRIHSDVRFAFKGTDRFALTARAALKADQLSGWVQALDTARGDLLVDISMPAEGGVPAFADITFVGPRFIWRNLEFDDLRGSGPLETGAVTLKHLEVGLGPGRLEGDGRLAWTADGDSHATLRGRDVDAAATLRTLFPKSPAIARFTPGALVSGEFTGSWHGWHAATLSGLLDTTWRRRPAGLRGPERYAASGRVRTRFARGSWTIDMDTRVDEALAVTGRWTLRASAADFARWPMDGSLTLDGETPGMLMTGLHLFDIDPVVDLAQASGDLTGTVSLTGTLGTPEAIVEVAGALAWPDQPEIESRAQAVITADTVRVTAFEATSGPARATSTLAIDLNRDTIDGQFDATSVPLESWLRRFDISAPVTGVVDAAGGVSGPLSRIVIDADITGGPVVVAGQPFDRVTGHVQYDRFMVRGTGVTLGRGEGTITGDLTWTRQGDGLEGTFQMTSVAFDTTVPGVVDVEGASAGVLRAVASGKATLGGTVQQPRIDLALSTPDVTLDARRFGSIHIEARTETAAVTRVAVTAADLGATLAGTVDLEGTRAFDLTARIDTPDSPLAVDSRGVALEVGAMTVEAQAIGHLASRTIDALDLTVQRLEGAVVGIDRTSTGTKVALQDEAHVATPTPLLPLAVQAGSRLSYRPELLTLSDVVVTSGSTRVTASGIFGSPDDTLRFDSAGRLEDLRALLLALAPAGVENLVFEGPARVTAVASGTFDRPTLKGSLELDGARLGDGIRPAFESVWVRLALDGEQIRLDLVEGRWQGAHMAMSGMVPTWFLHLPGSSRTTAQATVSGHVDDVTLKVLEPFVSPEALKATTFDSTLSFQFTSAEPDVASVMGDVVLNKAILRSRDLGIAQQGPARLHLERGVATLAPWTLGAPWSTRTAFTLGGAVTLPDGDRAAVLDIGVDGTVDLRALGLLFGGYRPAGTASINARLTGPITGPSVDGLVRVTDGELLIRDPRFVLSDLNGEVRFSGDRLTLEGVTGTINGGTLEAGGSMRQPGRGTPDGAITIAARGMLLEVPRGLRSAIDSDLTFAERPDGRFTLAGTITVVDAAYREAMLVTGGIMSLVSPRQDAVAVPDPDGPRATWLVLDLRARADDSIAIDTTFGKFSVGANLRVQGTLDRPRVTGTAAIAPGGELYVGGRTYQIESGVVDFRGQAAMRPDIRFNARTSVAGYDITLDIQTRSGVTETTLQSDPPLPEDDIASLLLSGQRRGNGDAVEAVTEQLAAALSGEIVGAVGRAIGIDSVRVEQGNPGDVLFDSSLISADTNPAQRLTFSKRVFPDLEVIVSQSLRESGDVTWIISWEPLSGLELRFVKLDDEDKSYEVRHDISFGGGVKRKHKAREGRETVRTVTVTTTGAISEAAARSLLKVTENKRFDFYDWQSDRERLVKWLVDNQHFEGRVVARRNPTAPPPLGTTAQTPVDLTYAIETGPRTELTIVGIAVPDTIRRELATAWVDVPVDGLLQEEFTSRLLPWLAEQGYLQPEIALELLGPGPRTDRGGQAPAKTASLTIAPGPRSTERVVVYTGNEGLTKADLDAAIVAAGLTRRVWTSPNEARAVVLAAYRRSGYLSARAEVGDVRFDGPRAELPIRIEEGPRFRAGIVRVDGVGAVPDVDTTTPIEEGTVLTDRLVADAVRELERKFRRAGYRGTRVTAESTTRADGGTVDLVFNVLLGQRARVQEIRVAGAKDTSTSFIERTMDVDTGEALSSDRLNRARDRLYDTGLFRTVTLETEPIPNPDGTPNPGALRANVTVEELPKYRLRYGFQLYDPSSPLFDPKWGQVDPGIVADLTRRGLFGRGLTGGVGTRLNPSEQTIRGYVSSRTFFGLPAQTNIFVSGEDQRTASAGLVLDSRSQTVSVDQRLRYRRLLQVGYGYSFEMRTFDYLLQLPTLPAPIPVQVEANIGRLLGSVVVDKRDDVINTRQGPFHSSTVEFGPTALGSTRGFRKYLGQQFYFVPWKRVTFGSAVRFEIAGGPGRGLITTERLRVGGANTVRGYEDDTLSLREISGNAEGTTSIVVLNQEIRFPLTARLQGATFLDYGHIYGETGDFGGLRFRNSVGAGVRLLLPFIIVRVDYGYPLNQDVRNDKGRWYFAIGQAF